MSLFRNKIYLSIILGHFTIDVFNNSGPILVTFLSTTILDITTAQIGLAIGLYNFVGSILQPATGWMVDRLGSRWLGAGSVAWTIVFLLGALVVAEITQSFILFLIPFTLASIGSGTFHPLGTKHATEVTVSQATTSTAIFFAFGQSGLAFGPILAGIILSNIGLTGIYILGLFAVPIIIFMAVALWSAEDGAAIEQPLIQSPQSHYRQLQWGIIFVLALVIGMRSWAFLGTVVFLPKIFQEQNWSATQYGLITGVFWFSSAITGAFAGGLADRWGRRRTLFFTLIIGAIPLYFLPLNDGWQAFPLAMIAGGLLGAPHSILVVIAQDLLPGEGGLTSGITLGYLFGVGAVAAWGVGYFGNLWGLTTVIQAGAGIAVGAALLALLLPQTRLVPQLQPEATF